MAVMRLAKEKEKKKKKEKTIRPDCETCQYFDFDEEYGDYVCNMMLDEDEMVRIMEHGAAECPYYRFYDEYTMVRKQN